MWWLRTFYDEPMEQYEDFECGEEGMMFLEDGCKGVDSMPCSEQFVELSQLKADSALLS